MRNILIIYPHWPPSNLAGVHRPRLIANYLTEFGWHPIVITVHQDYYEESQDVGLCQTVSDDVEVLKVAAWSVHKIRIIGDVGLRGFTHLYQQARAIIRERKIDFIWIPIPSFYVALLGRLLHEFYGTPYGIDYIDPWVRDISGRKNLRHLISNALARIFEPIVLKRSVLITGVSESYYLPALKRNFKSNQIFSLRSSINDFAKRNGSVIAHLAFPYGFDPRDHAIQIKVTLPWDDIPHCKPLIYAGAFLPNSRGFIDALFGSIRDLKNEGLWDMNVHLFFLGTGSYTGKSIAAYSIAYGIESIIHESKQRFPFLHILSFLSRSFGVILIGSTEPHYTASKVYQGILSRRPVLALLHQESSAAQVLKETNAGDFTIEWNETVNSHGFKQLIKETLLRLMSANDPWLPNFRLLEERYSSRTLAAEFSNGINVVLKSL